jgi:hypothetical protein
VTRAPISGASVTLLLNGGSAASCVQGGDATVTTNALGQYAFFILPDAACGGADRVYSLVVAHPDYTFVSTRIAPTPGNWPSGGGAVGTDGPPSGADPTTYYLSGLRPTLDLTNNNIPLDARSVSTPQPIPSLTTWGLILLSFLLAWSIQGRFQGRRGT